MCVYIHKYLQVYIVVFISYTCVSMYECLCTHFTMCVLLPWCWLPGCLHLFQNFQHCCSDSAQRYLLLFHGHPGRASAWRTSVRHHFTCSQWAVPLRLRALHPARAVIRENRHLEVGQGLGCCMVCRQ